LNHQLQWQTRTLLIDEAISAQALFCVEEYFLGHSMQLADALIAATCATHGLRLITANDKHYRVVKGLEIEVFRS
jgi:predicted nucleic acid-binding protein